MITKDCTRLEGMEFHITHLSRRITPAAKSVHAERLGRPAVHTLAIRAAAIFSHRACSEDRVP